MDRGQLGALDYKMTFPQQQYAERAPMQQEVANDSSYLPEEDHPLAVREKLTSDYYNNYGLLKSFVTEMRNQHIDPFKPDWSQEGGGPVFQTYQKLQAGVMYASNALKNEFQKEKQVDEARMRGDVRLKQGYDPTSQMYVENPDAYYSTRLDPRVVAANQRTAQNVYTQRDAANLNRAVYDPTYEALGNSGFSPEEQQYQQSALQPSVAETSYQQLIPRGRGAGQNSNEIEVLRKVTNLAQGVWPEGSYNPIAKGGKTVLENKAFAGETLGDYQTTDKKGNPKTYKKVVKRWIKDPDTGEVTIEFENPEIPSENVSNAKGDVVATSIIANNPKYGSAQKMYQDAREQGLLDDTSSAKNEMIISPEAGNIHQQHQAKASAINANLKQKYDTVKNQIKDLQGGFFETPDGRTVNVKKQFWGKDKYYIDNWEELGYSEEPKNLSMDDVLNQLDSFGFFNKYTTPAQTPVKQEPQVINKGGKKAY